MANLETGQAIQLWTGAAPGAVGDEDVDVPTITPFLPERANGAAMIVCPGGGYGHLAPHEGEPVASWLNTLGITSFVLKYRLGPRYRHPAPLQDVTRAVRFVRANAGTWKLKPDHIGVLGFSAGGHLASTIATQSQEGDADSDDPVQRATSRPDVTVLCYPVIAMQPPHAHKGCVTNLLGPDPADEQRQRMSSHLNASVSTPPAFIFHTADDAGVPVENALMYASALRAARVDFELHVYERGRHGVGLANDDPILRTWTDRCAEWLGRHGF